LSIQLVSIRKLILSMPPLRVYRTCALGTYAAASDLIAQHRGIGNGVSCSDVRCSFESLTQRRAERPRLAADAVRARVRAVVLPRASPLRNRGDRNSRRRSRHIPPPERRVALPRLAADAVLAQLRPGRRVPPSIVAPYLRASRQIRSARGGGAPPPSENG
jgi:hypothetical protein